MIRAATVCGLRAGTVDVVVVTYGGGRDLPACVDAVRRQGEAVARIVVIDNASPDDTAARAAAIGGVEVVCNATNVGYAAAMNQGYAMSSAPYLLSLNADCVLGDGYVDACVAALEAHDRAAAATGVLRLPNGLVDSSGIVMDAAYVAGERDRLQPTPTDADPFGVSGAAALWRRGALDALGATPWWEWLFMYWDDVEICWRLRRRGWTFLTVAGASAEHRRGSDSANPDFIEGLSLRNRLGTVARHAGVRGLVAPGSATKTITTAARLAIRHPRALRRAEPIAAIRAGLRQRRKDDDYLPVAR
jgi:GT2 family glycosyltransferase